MDTFSASLYLKKIAAVDWKQKTLLIQLLIIPVLLHLTWQILNKELPLSDSGDHYRISYMIYLAFKDGLTNGISYFFHTGGKPILFSAFAAPYIFISQPSIHLSIILTLITIQAVTITAYYWLFTLKIRPLFSALLSIVFITTPYVFSLHTQFMPETIWHMWFILFLAVLFRTKNLTNTFLTFLAGLFLGLTILARPVESIVLLLPPLGVYFYYLYYSKTIKSITNLCFICLTAFMPIFICTMTSIYNLDISYGFLSILLMGIILVISSKRSSWHNTEDTKHLTSCSHDNLSQIENFFLPVSLLCSVWLLFYGNALLGWMHDNSFGDGAKTNDQVNLHKSIFLIFKEIVGFYGSLTITTLFFLFTISICIRCLRNKNDWDKKIFYFGIAGVLLFITPMLFAYSITGTSDMRRIFLGVVFLMIVLSFYIFQKNPMPKFYEICGLIVLLAVLGIQILAISASITGNTYLWDRTNYLMTKVGELNYRSPHSTHSEDVTVVRMIKSLGISNAKIAVYSLGMFTDKVLYQAETLRYVTLNIDRSLSFAAPWGYTKYEPYNSVIKRLIANDFDYVLLEGLDDSVLDPNIRERMQSHTFFVHAMLQTINKDGENKLPSLALIKKFQIDDRVQYLYKIYDPSCPIITADSQLDNYGPEGLCVNKRPGWHAILPTTHPHVIHMDLVQQKVINSFDFLPQEDNGNRSPKNIKIEASNNDKLWRLVANPTDICDINTAGGGHKVKLQKPVRARFLRFVILQNCGDPSLVTLRGLKVA